MKLKLSLILALVLLSPLYAEASVLVFGGGSVPNAYVYTDAGINGGISNPGASGISVEVPSMQRACFLIDPSAYPSRWVGGQYHSPGDNSVIKWNGSAWYVTGAKKNYHLKQLDCSTDAKADTALSASKTQIAKGSSAQLTWLSQYGKVRKATFTSTNFDLNTTVPGHFESVPVYNPVCPGGGILNDFPLPNAAASLCAPFIAKVWVGEYTGPAPYGGTITVSPTVTTTYTYTSTNANGTETASVTIEVLDQPDPSCSDGQDNDADGSTDVADTDCQGGGSYTEIAPSNQPDLTASAVTQSTVPQGTPATLSAVIKNIGGLAVTGGFSNLFQIDNDEDHTNVFATRVAQHVAAGPATGVWQFQASDISDLACGGGARRENANAINPNGTICPEPDPTGLPCTVGQGRCKWSTWQGSSCTLDTSYYSCHGTTGGGDNPVPPGGTTDTQTTYTFPSGGTWYVRVCTDNDASFHGTVTESNENNNCSEGGWKAITVSSDSPGARLSASPAEVFSGDESTLTWACDKSTSASIDHGIGAVTPVAGGSIKTGALLAQTDYTLTCTGDDGIGHAYTSVRVKYPEVEIKAVPPLVKRGGATTISWSSVGANVCAISGPGLSSTLKNGSKTVTVDNQTTYTIICNGVSTDSVTVGLIPEFNEQ